MSFDSFIFTSCRALNFSWRITPVEYNNAPSRRWLIRLKYVLINSCKLCNRIFFQPSHADAPFSNLSIIAVRASIDAFVRIMFVLRELSYSFGTITSIMLLICGITVVWLHCIIMRAFSKAGISHFRSHPASCTKYSSISPEFLGCKVEQYFLVKRCKMWFAFDNVLSY